MDFFVAIALLLQTPAEVGGLQPQAQVLPPANSDAVTSGQAEAVADQRPIDQVLICRERRRSGTRMGHTECYSRSHANRAADVARETVGQMLEGSGHNNSASN